MKLTRARYQQMVGRAGRAGFDTHGESIMIVQPGEMPFVTNEILLAPTDRVESQLVEDDLRGLQQLILSLLSLDLGGKDRIQLAETLMLSTLLGQQVMVNFECSSSSIKHPSPLTNDVVFFLLSSRCACARLDSCLLVIFSFFFGRVLN